MMSLNTPSKEIKREVKKVLSTNFFYLFTSRISFLHSGTAWFSAGIRADLFNWYFDF
jgi:hypothetical protein